MIRHEHSVVVHRSSSILEHWRLSNSSGIRRLLSVPAIRFALSDIHFARHRAVTQSSGTAARRTNGGFGQPPAPPSDVHFEVSASAESADCSVVPRRGQSGQQADFTGVALQQRFGNRGGETKVRVRLIVARVMQIIGERIALDRPKPLLDLLAAFQAGPHARVPGGNPAATWLARSHPFIDGGG